MKIEAVSRTQARKVACWAAAGERCRGARGKPREAKHRERVEAANPRVESKAERDKRRLAAAYRAAERDPSRSLWDHFRAQSDEAADTIDSTAEEIG